MTRNFRQAQQELTELNADGNDTRGRYGEDYSVSSPWKDDLSAQERAIFEQATDPRNNQ